MIRSRFLIAAACLSMPLWGGTAWADEATEARLREALRTAISQQRASEDERTRLTARAAEQEKQIQALKADAEGKVQALERMEAEFNRILAQKGAAIADLNVSLGKWKTAQQEAAELARAKEAARVQLAALGARLTERAEACETKNAELFSVGNEILDRFASQDLGDVLAGKEPFLGLKRVELQNLVQDYQDKLLDQKLYAATR